MIRTPSQLSTGYRPGLDVRKDRVTAFVNKGTYKVYTAVLVSKVFKMFQGRARQLLAHLESEGLIQESVDDKGQLIGYVGKESQTGT